MDIARIRYAILGTLTIIWLNVILPYVKQIMRIGPIIFPRPPINSSEKHLLIATSIVLALSSFIFAYLEFKNSENTKPRTKKKFFPCCSEGPAHLIRFRKYSACISMSCPNISGICCREIKLKSSAETTPYTISPIGKRIKMMFMDEHEILSP